VAVAIAIFTEYSVVHLAGVVLLMQYTSKLKRRGIKLNIYSQKEYQLAVADADREEIPRCRA
jgi:hypothetical protein